MKQIKANQMTILVTLFMLFAGLFFMGSVRADNTEGNIDEVEITEVCNELFNALKAGNTRALAELFDGEILEKNRALLEQNKGYPKFLRDYYRDATFEVIEVLPDEDGIMVGIMSNFKDGRKETIYLHLGEYKGTNPKKNMTSRSSINGSKIWIISNQIKDNDAKEKRKRSNYRQTQSDTDMLSPMP